MTPNPDRTPALLIGPWLPPGPSVTLVKASRWSGLSRSPRLTSKTVRILGGAQIPTDASAEAERRAVASGGLICCSASVVGNQLSRLVETVHRLNQSSTSTGACEVTVSCGILRPAAPPRTCRVVGAWLIAVTCRWCKVAHHVAFGFDCVVQEDHRVSRII